jgi:hypothetical protein
MKNVKTVKFLGTPNHINRYLTHWTGRGKSDAEALNIICQIIKTRTLKLSPCPNIFNNNDGSKNTVPMVCFTETPIEHSIEHCNKFGFFGIGFEKQDMIKLGANPVLYIVPNRKYYQDTLNIYYWKELKEKWGAQTDVPFEIRNNLSWLLSVTQPYSDILNGTEREYYEQREWRIIRMLPYGVTNAEIQKWGPIDDGFKLNEIKIDNEERIINGVSENFLIGWLSFQQESIKNIIVPKKYRDEIIKIKEKENLIDCDILLV